MSDEPEGVTAPVRDRVGEGQVDELPVAARFSGCFSQGGPGRVADT